MDRPDHCTLGLVLVLLEIDRNVLRRARVTAMSRSGSPGREYIGEVLD